MFSIMYFKCNKLKILFIQFQFSAGDFNTWTF